MNTGNPVRSLDGHGDAVRAVAVTKDGAKIVSGSADKTYKVWNLADGKLLLTSPAQPAPILALAVSADGKRIAAGLGDNLVKLFDLAATDPAKAEVRRRPRPFRRDQRRGVPARQRVGRLGVARQVGQGLAPRSGRRAQDASSGHQGQVYSVAWSPDGKQFATGAADKSFRQWDVATGKQTRAVEKAHENVVYAIAYSPKGDVIATGGDDKLVKFWNAADGKELRKGVGHGQAIYGIAFSPDGTKLASGSVDKTIRIWNVADAKEVAKIDGHPHDIYSRRLQPRRQEARLGRLRREPVRLGRRRRRQAALPPDRRAHPRRIDHDDLQRRLEPRWADARHRGVGQQGIPVEAAVSRVAIQRAATDTGRSLHGNEVNAT